MKVTPDIREQIIQMRADGISVRECAVKFGIGKSTVSDVMRAYEKANKLEETKPVPESEPEATMSAPIEEQNAFLADIAPAQTATNPKDVAEQSAFLNKFKKHSTGQSDAVPAPPAGDESAFLAKFQKNLPRKGGGGRKARKAEPEDEVEEAPLPAPSKAPEPPPLDKGQLIVKITALITAYGSTILNLKDPQKTIESLQNKSVSELKTLMEMYETTKSVHTGAIVLNMMFGNVCMVLENVGSNFLKLRTEGYAQLMMSQQQQLQEIFRDIAFENVSSIKRFQRPEIRLGLLAVQTLQLVDARNRAMDHHQPLPVSEPVPIAQPTASEPAPVQDSFSDL